MKIAMREINDSTVRGYVKILMVEIYSTVRGYVKIVMGKVYSKYSQGICAESNGKVYS